jgi:hypothetical protein
MMVSCLSGLPEKGVDGDDAGKYTHSTNNR